MNTSERFTNAVTKLYNAFHQNRLNAYDCKACAVGNMCNGFAGWDSIIHRQRFNKNAPDLDNILNTGYSAHELANIESLFMFGRMNQSGDEPLFDELASDRNFKGLCAVVEYLCELEGIPNVMDYTSLFETENEQPKKQLQEVF